VGRFQLIRKPAPRAEHEGEDEGRDARRLVNHDPASKVHHAHVGQPAAAPNPMGHRRITKQHPQGRKRDDETKPDPLDIGADDQGRGDDREGHLKGEEQHLGDRPAEGFGVDADQEHLPESTPIRVRRAAIAKGNGIAEGKPQHRHNAGNRHALHQDRQHIS